MESYISLKSHFFKKGITLAVLSGMFYGLYSAFITLAMSKGVWAEWYDPAQTMLSAFAITYMLGALGSAVNDTFSAVWAIVIATARGKIGDFFRCLNTKPGRIMIVAALIGGPIASTAYIIGIQLAGSMAIPVTALCPAMGAILSRIFLKQPLNPRIICGILICVTAAVMIGSTSVGSDAPEGRFLGICIALIAALGWGFEGCIAGFATAMIDYEIGITIRQTVSGISNLIILLPLLALIAGDMGLFTDLTGQALTDSPSLIIFMISSFFALFAYSLWYKGNSMCGTALGMACNGTYSFWGPFFCWIVLGVILGHEGWNLPLIVWAAAVLMAVGIFIIAVDPFKSITKKEII